MPTAHLIQRRPEDFSERGFLRRGPEVAGEEFYEFVLLATGSTKALLHEGRAGRTEALHGQPKKNRTLRTMTKAKG